MRRPPLPAIPPYPHRALTTPLCPAARIGVCLRHRIPRRHPPRVVLRAPPPPPPRTLARGALTRGHRLPAQLNNDRRYVVVPAVALLTGALTYSTTMLRLPDREVLNSLFSAGPVHLGAKDAPEMTDPAIALVLYFVSCPHTPCSSSPPLRSPCAVLTRAHTHRSLSLPHSQCVKFFLTTLSVTLPISSGLFTPVFVVGAALGRLYGEGLTFLFDGVQPGGAVQTPAPQQRCLRLRSHPHPCGPTRQPTPWSPPPPSPPAPRTRCPPRSSCSSSPDSCTTCCPSCSESSSPT